MAFFSLSLKDMNMLKTHKQPSYKRIVLLLEKPKRLMASLLIANTFVNIGIILIANSFLDQWINSFGPVGNFVIKIIIITIVLVLFAEVLPKVWATNHKIWFASTSSMIVLMFNSLLSRISRQLVIVGDSIEHVFHRPAAIDDSQLVNAIDELPDNKASNEKKQILKGIRKFSNTTVKQTMRPRLDICGVENSSPFPEVLKKIKDYSYSRLPVYKGSLDQIVGILHTKDILLHLDQPKFEWQSLLRKVFYVHEQKLIEDLLQDFRNKRIHMAVVVDEFGGTSGLVTLEDIMEEIIGDIQDEFDDEQSGNKKIDDHTYIFEGKTMINDFCRMLNLPTHTFDLLRGESDSVAGLILEIAGEFPKVNAVYETNNYLFTVLEINKNRIEKVKVTIKEKADK